MVDLSKLRSSSFDPLIEQMSGRGPKRKRPKKMGLISRWLSGRTYDLRYDHGHVIEPCQGGFGFQSPWGSYRIFADPRDVPPEGEEVLIATGNASPSGAKKPKKMRPVLIGYANGDTGVVYTRRSWSKLYGRPFLIWVVVTPLLIAGLYACLSVEKAQHPFYLIGALLFGYWLLAAAVWPFAKFFQLRRARYQFKAHVSQLHRALGE